MQLKFELWPRQIRAFLTPARELLFGGATEGGKSHFVRVALCLWCGLISGLSCVLIRKKYDDIIKNHVEGPSGFRVLLSPLVDRGRVKITDSGVTFFHRTKNSSGQLVDNNSVITFKHCQDERQFDSAQGIEVHVLVIDEATQISERLIRFFRTWVRMSVEMKAALPDEWKGKFPRIIYTANPIGASVSFFKRHFVDRLPNEKIETIDGFPRQYLLSRYTDNLSVDVADHVGRLSGIGDPKLAKALDEGDWNALKGEFYPEWDESRHVIADMTPPAHWFRFKGYDWGTADPSYVAFAALSDGEPFRDDRNRERWFPRGAIIIYREWYICDDLDPSKGRRMRNEDMAEGIAMRSEPGHSKDPILTDAFPFADRGGETIAMIFARHGSILTHGDTSRVQGWSQLRSRLAGIEIDTNDVDENGQVLRTPMIYFCECCKYARDYIPALGRHPSESKSEDAQEHGEPTHVCDTIRLICMAKLTGVVKDKVQPMESRIKKELQSRKPTMSRILKARGVKVA